MNIFLPYDDPALCAQYLDDLRLNKMILETAQILCTASDTRGEPLINGYRPTHKNHPCVVWAVNFDNWCWLVDYFVALSREYFMRRGRQHKTEAVLLPEFIGDMPSNRDYLQRLSPFVNCTPYKNLDTHLAYKIILCEKWDGDKRPPKWTNRRTPKFYEEKEALLRLVR